jgi:hypothetical protein
MSGARVIVLLTAVVFATAVLPPAAAWTVNRSRIERARSDVMEIARVVGRKRLRPSHASATVEVLVGPGRIPLAPSAPAEPWLAAPRGSLGAVVVEAATLRSDPWGNAYLIHVRASGGVVLCAGPNGTIETPLSDAARSPGGDDIVAEFR